MIIKIGKYPNKATLLDLLIQPKCGLANCFPKGPGNKYFRLSWLYSVLALQHKNYHKQYANEWAWLRSNRIYYKKKAVSSIFPMSFRLCTHELKDQGHLDIFQWLKR